MARGLDQKTARTLAANGWTLSKLKQATLSELKTAGLDDAFINLLFKEDRPPIPTETLMSLLFANRYQCCVCRDPRVPIIVHHIQEWAETRSHHIANLAVVCLHHHDQAHAKKQLSQNLDAATLREFKTRWESEVKQSDAKAVWAAMRLEYSNWNYINELRVFEIANVLGMVFSEQEWFVHAVSSGVIRQDGLPLRIQNDNLHYMYEGPNIILRYLYVAGVLNEVVRRLPIINISDHLDKGVLGVAVVPGDTIFVQGAHVFSPLTEKKAGRGGGEICEGVRRANNVEVRFVFDRWEATSSSAKNCWLAGTRNQGSLVQVKDLSRSNGRLVIRGTALGICSNLGQLKTREYAQRWLEWMPTDRL